MPSGQHPLEEAGVGCAYPEAIKSRLIIAQFVGLWRSMCGLMVENCTTDLFDPSTCSVRRRSMTTPCGNLRIAKLTALVRRCETDRTIVALLKRASGLQAPLDRLLRERVS